MSYNILITSSGGRLSPEMIRLFKCSSRHDIAVIAVDYDKEASGRFFADYFETVPYGTDKSFSDEILNICLKYDVDMILPCSDEEVISLASREKDFLERDIVLAMPEKNTLKFLVDKAETYKLMKSMSLPTPEWKIINQRESALSIIETFLLKFGTCVVKPTTGRGGRGVYIISKNSKEFIHANDARDTIIDFKTFCSDYLKIVQKNLPVIVMETLTGPGYDVDVLSIKGEVKRMVPRKRFISSGTPFKGSLICWPEEVVNLTTKVTKSFNLSWLQDFDLMTDREGKLQFTEINPRPSGGIVSSVKAGIPLFDDLISLAKKEDIPDVNMKNVVAVVPYTSTMIVSEKLAPDGK